MKTRNLKNLYEHLKNWKWAKIKLVSNSKIAPVILGFVLAIFAETSLAVSPNLQGVSHLPGGDTKGWIATVPEHPEIVEMRVTSDTAVPCYELYNLSDYISGDKIVWQDYRNRLNWDVYIWDPVDGERPVCTNPIAQYSPSISGNKIVWSDYRNGNGDIYMYDLSSGQETQITTDPAHEINSSISGDKIVFLRGAGAYLSYDIYIWDPINDEHKIANVSNSHFRPLFPDISGDKVVWEDYRNGNWDIYMWDPVNGEQQITTDPADQNDPSISGDRIVWHDNRNGNYDIYMWIMEKGVQQITNDLSNQYHPSISGNKVVWQDGRNGNYDIYMYDISTGKERQITNHPANQECPSISGNNIAWFDKRGDRGGDIYMAVIIISPAQQIAEILDFFDLSVYGGTLQGNGPGKSAGNRLGALRNMIESAGDLIEDDFLEEACLQLIAAYRKTDGLYPPESPPDFVMGDAAPELASMIMNLIDSLECE